MLPKNVIEQIERTHGKEIRYSKDCEILAAEISEKTGFRISPSTVKRLLGFINTDSKPNKFTLDTIAVYLGYKRWEELQLTGKTITRKDNQNRTSEIIPVKEILDTETINQSKPGKYKVSIIILLIAITIVCGFMVKMNSDNPGESNTFTHLPEMPEARNGGRAVSNNDNIFYLGGADAAFVRNNLWNLNLETKIWKEKSPMSISRAEMATAMVGEKIYCFGGWLGNDKGMTDLAEVYSVKENRWETLNRLPVKITSAFGTSAGKSIYILGGTVGETETYFLRFNTSDHSYEKLPVFSQKRMYCPLVFSNDRIFAVGGNSFTKGEYKWSNNLDVYDIKKNKWFEMTPMPVAVSRHSATLVGNEIHITGGSDKFGDNNEGIKNLHLVYKIDENKWYQKSNLPFPVCAHQTVNSKNRIILLGGTSEFPNPNKKVCEF